MGYRPGPKRRSYIPKAGSERGRPLGISNLEDKIVEEATKRTLEPIYEAVFEDSSHAYRPGRSQHQCLDELGRTIQRKNVNYVVEADIKRFFDKVNHEWMIKFLRHRIGDERVIRLIIRMLKSGIMEDGLIHASEEGTPQGSILSPLLSNIYLHYVLDLWFSRRVSRQSRGEVYYFRFADDFVACVQYKDAWIDQMCHMVGAHKPMTWFAEAGPIRRSIEPFLRKRMDERRTFCNIEWLPSIMDKSTRARAFQAMASMGKVKVPKDKSWFSRVMAQWLQFPAGRYDDAVDAASLMGRGLEFTRSARKYEPLPYTDLRIP